VAYPSLKPLGVWYADLLQRHKQLESWNTDLQLPSSIWLSGLFNPQSFLRAIVQTTARKNEWPLDKMGLQTEVTKKTLEELKGAPREGAFIHGLYIEGARWDMQSMMLKDSHMKELFPLMPLLFLKPVPLDKMEVKDLYHCPLYVTRKRGPTYAWTFQLRTKESENKWILLGVSLLLDIA
jgi:dynein heavy chain, axonemal